MMIIIKIIHNNNRSDNNRWLIYKILDSVNYICDIYKLRIVLTFIVHYVYCTLSIYSLDTRQKYYWR